MYQKDKELGAKVREHLESLHLQGPTKLTSKHLPESKETFISVHMRDVLDMLGLDTSSPDIIDTPRRVAKMYSKELFYGLDYDNFPKCTTTPNSKFTGKQHGVDGECIMQYFYDEMVLEKGITVHSMCEHHLIPFIGNASVAYIPKDKLLGLSKLNRVTDFFARRPQVQERLTAQICAALQMILDTSDVAVVVECEHLCVKLRGVQHQTSSTVTSKLGGRFLSNPALRNEFLSLSQ